MKLNPPVLPREPEEVSDLDALLRTAQEEEIDIVGQRVAGALLAGRELDSLCFRSSYLENVRLTDCSLRRTAFLDTVFESCDLSNSDFDNALFQRCRFHGCKGVGTLLARARLFHVSFEDSDLRYSVWDAASLRRVRFDSVTLDGSSFGDCAFDPVVFQESSLIGAGFLHTSLAHRSDLLPAGGDSGCGF